MSDTSPSVMIFAAGFGTRMKHLVRKRPKPMIPVGGQPLIDRALAIVRDVNPPRIVVNLHYLADVLETHLAGQGITTLREEPDILDTGGGLKHALDSLGTDPVITMNPDVIWAGPNPLRTVLHAWDPDRMDALLLCIPMARVRGRMGNGDFHLDAHNRLHRQGDLVYGGVQVMKTTRLNDISDNTFSLNVVWDRMAQEGRLFGTIYPGQWCDVGHPEGISIAEQMLDENSV